jgi:hypothetical protein
MNHSMLYPILNIIGTILFLLMCYSEYRKNKFLPADVVEDRRTRITTWLLLAISISFFVFLIFREALSIKFINGINLIVFILIVVGFIRELILNRNSKSLDHN